MKQLVKYGIYLAEVYFQDQPTVSKTRPVIVLNVEELEVLILKVTSNIDQSRSPAYFLENWEQYHLKKPSSVILYPAYRLNPSKIYEDRFLAQLSQIDINNISQQLTE